MATEAATSTKDQVKALMDQGMDAAGIAEKLGKSKANIYVHMRNLKSEAGEKPRGRGRPPKVGKDGSTPAKSRPAPPKAAEEPEAKPLDEGNGHLTGANRFPLIRDAIEQELAEKRREVALLERMLEAASK